SAGGGDTAGELVDRDGDTGWTLRRDPGVCGVGGRVVLWLECAGAVCSAAPGAVERCRNAISSARPSVDDDCVCGGVLAGGGKFVLSVSAECADRLGNLASGRTVVFLLEQDQPESRRDAERTELEKSRETNAAGRKSPIEGHAAILRGGLAPPAEAPDPGKS